MFRERFVTAFAMAFAVGSLTAGAAWAGQDRTSNGNTTGTSAPRSDGGSSSGSSGSSGGSSSGSSSSGSSGAWGGSSSSSSPVFEAPRRSDDQSSRGGRSAGGNERTGSAVSRGGDSAPRGGGSTSSTGDRSSGSSASSDDAPSRRGVPAYSRPRDGRPVTGVAVERGSVLSPIGGNVIYYPYNPWGFWGPGYGYGLGYLFYDPWYGGGYGYGDPYGYGSGYGSGYGGYGSGGYGVSRQYRDTGSLRLKVDPKQAQVFIDGYYVGTVDDFDGAFQTVELEAGGHRVELKAAGFETASFEVLITPGETVTYKGGMKAGSK